MKSFKSCQDVLVDRFSTINLYPVLRPGGFPLRLGGDLRRDDNFESLACSRRSLPPNSLVPSKSLTASSASLASSNSQNP